MLDNRGCMGKRYSSKECPHCLEGKEEGVEETSLPWISHCSYIVFCIPCMCAD